MAAGRFVLKTIVRKKSDSLLPAKFSDPFRPRSGETKGEGPVKWLSAPPVLELVGFA
jgi:hypothetical protein